MFVCSNIPLPLLCKFSSFNLLVRLCFFFLFERWSFSSKVAENFLWNILLWRILYYRSERSISSANVWNLMFPITVCSWYYNEINEKRTNDERECRYKILPYKKLVNMQKVSSKNLHHSVYSRNFLPCKNLNTKQNSRTI